MELPEAPSAIIPSPSPPPEDGAAPDDLVFDEHVFSLAFHPFRDLVAAGLIGGDIHAFQYNVEENTPLSTYSFHSGSCRALQFTLDGNFLVSASQDQSVAVIDCETGQRVLHLARAHDEPIYSLLLFPWKQTELLATGDDEGVIKLWDTRQRRAVVSFTEHEDYVASFARKPSVRSSPSLSSSSSSVTSPCPLEDPYLLASGGDGYLSVWDLRRNALEAMSDNMEDELLSMAIVKNGRKVVVGTADGVLDIFRWGYWGDMNDRFPGHPQSIDAMLPIDDDTVATGSSDGLIRVVSILPNKLLGVIGEHQNFPIEHLAMSRDRVLLGSCSHDQTVKFWNVQYLYEQDDDSDEQDRDADARLSDEDEEDEDEDDSSTAAPSTAAAAASSSSSSGGGGGSSGESKPKKKKKADFFKDL